MTAAKPHSSSAADFTRAYIDEHPSVREGLTTPLRSLARAILGATAPRIGGPRYAC